MKRQTDFVSFDLKLWEMCQVYPEVASLVSDLDLCSQADYERYETEEFVRRSVELSNDLRKKMNFGYSIDDFVAGCILNGGCPVGTLFN